MNTTFKLARWVERFQCFQDGKRRYATEAAARAAATAPGTYRISEVSDNGRRDLEPFHVEANPPAPVAMPTRTLPRHAARPMSGRPH